MITAQDVRVGNWLKSHLTGEYVKVDWLVIKHLLDGNIQSVYQPSIPVYEPVVLTPEILERAGFIQIAEIKNTFFRGLYSLRKEKVLDNPAWEFYIHYGGGFMRLSDIDYLHQLQNLFFALCGTEIDINL
jgi:hypothetical protein